VTFLAEQLAEQAWAAENDHWDHIREFELTA